MKLSQNSTYINCVLSITNFDDNLVSHPFQTLDFMMCVTHIIVKESNNHKIHWFAF